jgi:GntR family transcriptional regulator
VAAVLRSSPEPAHVQIERWFVDSIGRGTLAPGDRLPREQDLAASFGVSRMTLRQALSTLAGRGVVLRIPGRFGGTFIVEPRVECDLTGFSGFTEQLRRANVRAGARVVEAATVTAERTVTAALGLGAQALVHRIVRVRTAKRVPLVLECSYFPAQAFPDLVSHGLTGSLYTLLRKRYGLAPTTATEVLDPVVADVDTARLLGTEPGTPLLRITRTAQAASGQPVEYARDVFRPDRVRVSVRSGVSA